MAFIYLVFYGIFDLISHYSPLALASENGFLRIVQLLLNKEEIDPCIETISI